jgi:hypothetical protein
MLSEPREALPRTSTFTVTAGEPVLIDVTTVYKTSWTDAKDPSITHVAMANRDKAPLYTQGIYEVQRGTLKYCIAAPGLPRPTAFETREGDGRTLVMLRPATRAVTQPPARAGSGASVASPDNTPLLQSSR